MSDLPQKMPGWIDYLYPLRQGLGVACAKETFFHKGRTPQMEERERMRRWMLLDIAMHLAEFLAGPLNLDLSEWEAKRVAKLVQNMRDGEVSAQEVWEGLSPTLQVAVLESADPSRLLREIAVANEMHAEFAALAA
jgi:demethoxyubiquinone hydroxylase (CLK1/Coq7/Cat5 family)